MKSTDLAWAAGIVDGEGTIAMTRNRPGVNRRVTLSFQIRMSVRMTHENTILRLQKILGGIVRPSKSRNPIRHKPAWEWYVGDLKTTDILRKIMRYMTTKKKQASLVLEFRSKCFKKRPSGRGSTCDPVTVRTRLMYFNKLKELNRKGPSL